MPVPPRAPLRFARVICAVGVGATLLGLTYSLGGYRAETLRWASPMMLGLVVVAWVIRARSAEQPAVPGWLALLPVPFLAWAAWHALVYSPVPWLAVMELQLWLFAAAGFWLGLELAAERGARTCLLMAGGATVLMAAGAAVYQRAVDPTWLPLDRVQAPQYLSRSSGTFGIPNSLAALMLLALPFSLSLALRRASRGFRASAGLVAVAAVLGLLLSISRSGWFAAIAALLVFPWLLVGRSARQRLLLTAILVGTVAAVGVTAWWISPAVRERVAAMRAEGGERTRPLMWRISAALWEENPLIGTGGGSFRVLLERHRPAGFRDDPKWAHNEYLNTLSDYGLIGASLLAVPMLAAGVAWRRRFSREARSGSAAVTGIEVALLGLAFALAFDFHLKIPALGAWSGMLVGAWFVLTSPPRSPPTSGRVARMSWGLGALVLAIGAGMSVPIWRSEALRQDARAALDRAGESVDLPETGARLRLVTNQLRRATEAWAGNAQAWSDLCLALSQTAHDPAADRQLVGREAEQAARRALAVSQAPAAHWVGLGIALDLQGRWHEGGQAFARAVQLAPQHPLPWYYQAHHYALQRTTLPLARASLDNCLRLDPWHPQAWQLFERLQSR